MYKGFAFLFNKLLFIKKLYFNLLVLIVCFGMFMQVTDLPFSLYRTFVIESRHGFNKVCILSKSFFNSSRVISWFHDLLFWNISYFISHITGTGIKILFFCFSFFLFPFGFYPVSRCFLTLLSSVLQQTVWLFFRDSFKGIGVAVVRGPLIVSAIIIIVQVRSRLSA
jgi:hypothetical protein